MAIVPALSSDDDIPMAELAPAAPARLNRWVRIGLVLMALGLIGVFGIARWLNPRDENGNPRTMATHRQLGLPPCTFYFVTGLPCPSCGMTTSFSHLAHGDLVNSLKANAMGTLLAFASLAAVPWCLASAIWGRRLGVHDLELFLARGVLVFFGLLLVTWGIRLLVMWLSA